MDIGSSFCVPGPLAYAARVALSVMSRVAYHADHVVVAQTTSWFQVVKAQLRKAAQLSPHGTLVSEALAGLRTEHECKSQRDDPRIHKYMGLDASNQQVSPLTAGFLSLIIRFNN